MERFWPYRGLPQPLTSCIQQRMKNVMHKLMGILGSVSERFTYEIRLALNTGLSFRVCCSVMWGPSGFTVICFSVDLSTKISHNRFLGLLTRCSLCSD